MKKLFILITLLLTIFSFNATAATYDVCSSGCDYTQSGFEALSGDKGGNTYFFSGTFTSTIDVNIDNATLDGYEADNTTYMNLSEVAGRAKVDISSNSGIRMENCSNITIQDFEITGGADRGMYATASNNILMRRNYVYLVSSGSTIANSSYNITWGGSAGHGNVFKNCGQDTADEDIALASGCHDIIISYNHLYATLSTWGIDGVLFSTGVYDVLIEYNSIHDHNDSSGYDGEDGIDSKYGSDVIIRFNDIYNNKHQAGISIQKDSRRFYIYGNRLANNLWSGIFIKDNSSSRTPGDFYIFSCLFEGEDHAGIGEDYDSPAYTLSNIQVYNNTFIESGDDVSSAKHTAIRPVGENYIIKNNIFYKSRPSESDYTQIYVEPSLDDDVTMDYNWYYWPSQTSKIFWGDGGSLTVDQVQAGSSNGLPQETGLLANEGDPGLTDIGGGDYTIAPGAAVIGKGIDMGTGAIVILVIQGVSYSVYWDIALADGTSFPGNGTIPTIVTVSRDSYDAWDIGAYQSGAPIISDPYPTSQQPCDNGDSTDTVGVTSSSNCNCKKSVKGVDTCATAFGDLDDSFTGGEGTTDHTFSSTTNCDATTTYVVKCQDTTTSLVSNCLEIIHDVAAGGGSPPQPPPAGIVPPGNLTIQPGPTANVTVQP